MEKRDPKIYDLIPQREPFLFLDRIVEQDENSLQASYLVSGEEDFLKGHFPGNPIVPGVILQEACFQAGAALMSGRSADGLGVVSRVQDVKFRQLVKPQDELNIYVKIDELLGNAFYMSGRIKVEGKTVMAIKFTGSLIEGE